MLSKALCMLYAEHSGVNFGMISKTFMESIGFFFLNHNSWQALMTVSSDIDEASYDDMNSDLI